MNVQSVKERVLGVVAKASLVEALPSVAFLGLVEGLLIPDPWISIPCGIVTGMAVPVAYGMRKQRRPEPVQSDLLGVPITVAAQDVGQHPQLVAIVWHSGHLTVSSCLDLVDQAAVLAMVAENVRNRAVGEASWEEA